MENENLITYNNVLIRQGEYDIVKDVTFSVNKGDFVFISLALLVLERVPFSEHFMQT